MAFPPGQIPNQPGIYCAESKFALICELIRAFDVAQNPIDLWSGEVSVRNETCFVAKDL